jgi:hypothetical protein
MPLTSSARNQLRLEHRHVVAVLNQLIGAGDSARAGTDDGDAKAIGRCDNRLNCAVRESVVVDKALNCADSHRVALAVQETRAFAEPFLRADARADLRQVAGGGRKCGGGEKLALGRERHQLWNPVVQRTALHAHRARALNATTGLRLDGGGVKHTVDFAKIPDAFLGRAFGRRGARNRGPGVLGIFQQRVGFVHCSFLSPLPIPADASDLRLSERGENVSSQNGDVRPTCRFRPSYPFSRPASGAPAWPALHVTNSGGAEQIGMEKTGEGPNSAYYAMRSRPLPRSDCH